MVLLNVVYWFDIGQLLEIVNGLVQQVVSYIVEISEFDGSFIVQVLCFGVLLVVICDDVDDGNGVMVDVLCGWKIVVWVVQEEIVWVIENEVQVICMMLLEVCIVDVEGCIVMVEWVVISDCQVIV